MTKFSGIKCDRCGNESRVIRPVMWKRITVLDNTRGDREYDLCPGCLVALSQWLGGWSEELSDD